MSLMHNSMKSSASSPQKKPEIFFNHGSSDIYQKLIANAKAAGLRTNFMGVNSGSTQIVHSLGLLARGMVFTQVVPNPCNESM